MYHHLFIPLKVLDSTNMPISYLYRIYPNIVWWCKWSCQSNVKFSYIHVSGQFPVVQNLAIYSKVTFIITVYLFYEGWTLVLCNWYFYKDVALVFTWVFWFAPARTWLQCCKQEEITQWFWSSKKGGRQWSSHHQHGVKSKAIFLMFIKQKSLIIESPWSRVMMQGSTPRVVCSSNPT